MIRIVFHGENAASFLDGFSALLHAQHDILALPDTLSSERERRSYADAEVIIGVRFDDSLPKPQNLRLFHVPGAGYDAVDLSRLPASAVVCNCFGHEQAIAEYVFTALLTRQVPLTDADLQLRQGKWSYYAGAPGRLHGELAGTTIGLLGFGHIGKAIATRAKAFEMRVHVANRSPVPVSPLVDQAWTLDNLAPFYASADVIVISVPLAANTKGMVAAAAFAAMRSHAILINVGRGAIVDEQSLFDALKEQRIAAAVIDTWYQYPSADHPLTLPSRLPFHELPNIVMTPHMSGWTAGTIRRRQQTMADNIRRLFSNEGCRNVIRAVGH